MNWIKKIIKNMAALLIGIIMSLLIMECILRIYNPFESRVKGDKIILPTNKKYVIKGNKNKKISSKFDETIFHTKNSLGFRGEEPPEDIEKYLTIITVGGSTTECTFLSDGKTWTDIFGKKLTNNFANVWINNAGFDGHSTFGHTVLMEDYIVKLRPDIVFFLIGANDQGMVDFRENDQEYMRNRFMLHSLSGFLKSMANHSEVFSLGLNVYRYGKARVRGIEHNIFDFEMFRNVDISRYRTEEVKEKQRDEIERYKKNHLSGFKKRLEGLIQISRKHGIAPVLITQPTLYGDFVDDMTSINFSFTKFNWELLELYNDVTRRVGADENVLVIDLAKEMPKSTLYYYDWFHFTNKGAEKVAEILYGKLNTYLKNMYPWHLTKEETKSRYGYAW
jgi:lysophospholipase L1-like esterase